MEQESVCPHCGSRLLEHRHRLSQGLVRALLTVYRASPWAAVRVSDLVLDHSQLANFQKLAYWRLVEPHITEETGHRRGWWKITRFGRDFIQGRQELAPLVWTFRGKPKRWEGAPVRISDIVEGYECRGDYAAAAQSPQPQQPEDHQLTLPGGSPA